jgi:photosystem II stability/assembly factor-like uncharacterized protein
VSRERRDRWQARLDGESLPAGDDTLPPPGHAGPGRPPLPPAGVRVADAAAHHWIFTGPRNVGGRIRALALHPTADGVLYAGTASGGIFRTDDRGESWRALWHEERSLSIAAIAIAPQDPALIYVATGEPPGVPGAGIYRSTDDGASWRLIAPAASLLDSVHFEQIVVHPGSEPGMKGVVYAVGPRGVFRSTNADAADPADVRFQRLSEGPGENLDEPTAYSDAAFGASQADATRFFLYLCRARSVGGEIVRIERPEAAHADVELALRTATNRKAVLPADPATLPAGSPQWSERETARGRITLCRDHANVMYAAFARNSQDHRNAGVTTGLRAIMRCREANRPGSFSGTDWREIPYRASGSPNDFANEDFGWWTLMISVHPTDPELVFFGMVGLYICRDANHASPSWHPAMPPFMWRVDKAYHADNHAVVFDRQGEAWLAYDAGVAVTANLATWLADSTRTDYRSGEGTMTRAAIPANPLRWRRRIHGLVAVQAYDVTQSPLVPTMVGCGLQDMGVWYSAGGETWRWALDGDGGFTAFDPDDPYRVIMTWQSAVHSAAFAGTVERAVPAPDVFFHLFGWSRALTEGFLRVDGARFTGDTIHHARKIDRIVTLRENRAYGTRNGERFVPLTAGAYPEVVITFRHRQTIFPDPEGSQFHHNGMALVEVRDTEGARKLGFRPATTLSTFNRTRNPFSIAAAPNPTAPAQPYATNIVRVRGVNPERFALVAGDTLELLLRCRDRGGTERDFIARVEFVASPLIPDLAVATAEQVAAFIRARVVVTEPAPVAGDFLIEVAAWPAFGAAPAAVELTTTARTTSTTTAALEIGGTSGVPQAFGLSPGRYVGAPGLPATVSLTLTRLGRRRGESVGVPSGATLTVAVDGGAAATVTFDHASFNDLTAIRSGELVAALQAVIGPDATAVPNRLAKAMLIRRRAPGGTATVVTAGSTALAELTSGNAPPGRPTAVDRPGAEPELYFFPHTRSNAFDLHETTPGTARRLIVRGAAAGGDVTIDFDAAGFVDRASATVEEVVAKVSARLAAVPAADLRCDLLQWTSFGEPTEAAYDPHTPDALWIGGMDGTIWRSPDDGQTWRRIPVPRFARKMRAIEAIAVHPADSRITFVGLAAASNDSSGSPTEPTAVGDEGDDGTLYVTEDAGIHWRALGRDVLTVPDDPSDPASRRRPIGAVEVLVDPASTALATTRLWVATYVGVFESRDGGQTFAPMNEGLPNVRVTDLAYEPSHQLLRCATFGRGTYARYVGSRAANPAPLYLRTSLLDDGTSRPADDGYDGFAGYPQQARRWESPDIKVSALPWTSSSATRPELGATPAQIDGVELDEEVEHQPFGVGAGPVNVFVQVHSRSAVAIADARVIVQWADGRQGPPPLGLEFWTAANLAAATPVVPAGSAWHLVGAAAVAPPVSADRPAVVRIELDPPAEMAGFDELGLLAIVTSAAHPTAAPASDDVARVLDAEPRVAYRATRTRIAREAQSLVLSHERGGIFTVAESPAPPRLGLAGTGVRAARSSVAATFDVRPVGANQRSLTITAELTPVSIELRAADFADAAAATPAELRRVLERELRLARLPVRCRLGEVALSVRGPDRAAALVAVGETTLFAADLMVLGRWQRGGTLSRATAQHLYLRVANEGEAPEESIAWRVYAVDPTAVPLTLRAADVIGSGTLADLDPGASQVVHVNAAYLPGGPAGATHRLLVAVSEAVGDPLRTPFVAPPAEVSLPGLAELDAYCAVNPSVAYRVFELVP